ncbi:MAG: exodeoxyribonuclease III [Alphaproteobacteria bacterium]|nr:exodeoxyribonuclease III [Alphaproteobacteria bacterium]
MRIVTWNINSVRLRLPLLQRLVEDLDPDVVLLQETKVQDPQFPLKDIAKLGLTHSAIRGMKSYNGVAILSKHPLTDPDGHDWVGRDDARHVLATLPNGVEIHSLYVPAGGDEPDPAVNDKFRHKLDFVSEMTDWFPRARDPKAPILLAGDLNIAPLESDVWSHKQLLKVVSHTPVETEGLARAQEAFGWIDAMRAHTPAPERLYTWWSYRAKDWRAADRGRRLDHVWLSPGLEGTLRAMRVIEDARGWEKPSDHAPVVVDLDL